MKTVTKVPFWTVACIQIGALAHCIGLDRSKLHEIFDLPGATKKPIEFFALAYIKRVVNKYLPRRTAEMGIATNSDEVCNMLMQHWGLKNEELFGTSFTTPEMEIDVEKENDRPSTDISALDLAYLGNAIQALAQEGINLNICVDGQIPQRLANDGPVGLIFPKGHCPESVTQFIHAKSHLDNGFSRSQWFQFVVFALRLHNGESIPVPKQTLDTMKQNPYSLLSFIAEAYEDALKFAGQD